MNVPAEMYEQARAVASNAYAPYSRFRVGAIAVADDGRVFAGCNVENAAYGSTICAEANAISTAAAAGVRKITTVVVACLDGEKCPPCGNCRQLMREFAVDTVVVQDGDRSWQQYRLEEMLPYSFGPDSLTNVEEKAK